MLGKLADEDVTSARIIERAGCIAGIGCTLGRDGREHDGLTCPSEISGLLLQLFQCQLLLHDLILCCTLVQFKQETG